MDKELYEITNEKYLWIVDDYDLDELPLCVYRDNAGTNIDYSNIWNLDATKVVCVIVPRDLICKCGFLNKELIEACTFEYLVRLLKHTDKCHLLSMRDIEESTHLRNISNMITSLDEEIQVDFDQLARTYAYIVRSNLDYWNKNNLTDKLFNKICSIMKEYNAFDLFQKHLNIFISDWLSYYEIEADTAPFVVLRGDDTCNGVLQRLADEVAGALIDNKQAVITIGNSIDGNEDYDGLRSKIVKGIIGFQTKALEIDYFQDINGPKFQFWMDNPLHFKGVLRNLNSDYYILCQDENYANLIKNYYNTKGALHFPFGGIYQKKEYGERPYDIVFIGSYFDDSYKELTPKQLEFYKYMIKHPNMSFEDGLLSMIGDTCLYNNKEFEELLYELKPACRAVIGHIRIKVVCAILEAGYQLHVYGVGWNKLSEYKNLVVHELVSVDESLRELHKAKIGLNIMSWHKAGMTERIANIMLSGAVCLSDETTYLNGYTDNGNNILLYNLEKLDELPQLIDSVLLDSEKREMIASNSYNLAINEYTWQKRAEELIQIAEDYSKNKSELRIFVATHVAFSAPDIDIYLPIQVGKAGKSALGYLGDDTGINISDLNYLYGELTGLFWIWQNVHNVKYIGLCHYRRYFINEKLKVLEECEYREILEKYDAIVPKHMECATTYYEHYGAAHNNRDLDAVKIALKKLYPEYSDSFDKAMSGKVYYYGNLMVTSSDIIKAYAEWLFNIFIEASEDIDVSEYDEYHARVYGFLSEQMFYVYAMKNELKLYECRVGVCAEKAETKELVSRLKVLIEEGDIDKARGIFEEQTKIRPDLLLAGSDINNELINIRSLLYKRK